MEIKGYYSLDEREQAAMRDAIGKAEWSGATLLAAWLKNGMLPEKCGAGIRLLLGVEGECLASFLTLAPRDDVDSPLTPWIGFVYTFPAFRGQHRAGTLIEHACMLAKEEGHARVYVSTNATGLYERYGFEFLCMDTDVWGGDTRVYVRTL